MMYNQSAAPVPLAPLLYHPNDPGVNRQDSTHRPSPAVPFSTPSYSAVVRKPYYQIATGGEWARVSRPIPGEPAPREWKRGAISNFTPRARSRMLQSVAKTDRRPISDNGTFITLTYPADWPPSTRACKQHLEAFRKRITRRFPGVWWYWKLEYQKRGAEHFHLLAFDLPTVQPEQIKRLWRDIVKLGDDWHEKFGADIKRLHSWREASSYCAKYVAKVEADPSHPTPGRFWGISNRANRHETIVTAPISEGEFYRIRRIIRGYMGKRRGYHAPGGPRSGVWTRISNEGAKRILGNAAGEDPPPRLIDPKTGELRSSGPGTLPGGNCWNNTDTGAHAQPSRIGRTMHNASMPLFSPEDAHRRSAIRACA